MELTSIENEVERILERYPATRDSDTKLLASYFSYKCIPNINVISFFNEYAKYREKYNLPSLETITRARRKIQERRADLQASDPVKDARGEIQLEFWQWAK